MTGNKAVACETVYASLFSTRQQKPRFLMVHGRSEVAPTVSYTGRHTPVERAALAIWQRMVKLHSLKQEPNVMFRHVLNVQVSDNGVLTGKYKPGQQPQQGTRAANPSINSFMSDIMSDETLTAVQHLHELAQQNGYTLSQLALAWILRQDNVSATIIGASRPAQVEDNVKAIEVTLTDDMLQHIDQILDSAISYARE